MRRIESNTHTHTHTTYPHTHHPHHKLQAGFVTVETIEGAGIQGEAYNRCLRNAKARRLEEWLALIDVDEYLFLGDHGCLMNYLQYLDERAALTVNWRTYSPSNQILPVPPDRLLIESNVYTRADDAELGMDRHVKSIVHVNRTVSCPGPQFCRYRAKWSAKDERGRAMEGPFNYHVPNRYVHLNHYPLRSYTDFLMERLPGKGVHTGHFDDVSNYVAMAARMASVREDIQPAVEPVRRILGLE